MAVTSPDNIWTPDSGDEYALTVDLAAMADTVQDALNLRGTLVVSDLDELNAVASPHPGAVAVVLELGAIFRYSSAAVWVQATEASFSGAAARDTAYAKAGGVYKASGALVHRTDKGWTERWYPSSVVPIEGWVPESGHLPQAAFNCAGALTNALELDMGASSYPFIESRDLYNWHADGSTQVIPSIPGRYRLSLACQWSQNTGGSRLMRLKVNGNAAPTFGGGAMARTTNDVGAFGDMSITTEGVYLNGTDAITFSLYQDSGAHLSFDARLSVVYLGPALTSLPLP